jgi:hypothetical protein
VFRSSVRPYRDMLRAATGPALIAGFVLLLLVSGRRSRELRALARHWRLLVPALFAFVLYAAVHVENRFVGGFLATTAAIGFALIPWPTGDRARIFATAVVAAVLAVGLWSNLRVPIDTAARGQADVEAARQAASDEQEAAIALRRLGCRHMALIAPPDVQVQSYFPRLARMSIVVGITRPQKDWSDTTRLDEALTRSRAQLLVARDVPAEGHRTWMRLGSSSYFVHRGVTGSRARAGSGPGC